MTTNFPTSLDTFTNPLATDALNSGTVPHTGQHDNLNDAVLAIETALGAGLVNVIKPLTSVPLSTSIGLVLKGAASQTADLQQWQDSTGAVLSGVNAAGQAYFGTTASVIASTPAGLSSAAYTSATVAVFTLGVPWVQVGQRVVVAGVTGGTYNGTWIVTSVTSTTFTVLGSGFTNIAGTGGTVKASAVGAFVSSSPFVTSLIVQAAAASFVNMQEWQNNTGAVVASVDQGGGLNTNAGVIMLANNTTIADLAGVSPIISFGTGKISITARTSTFTPLVIQGVASQTADLQQWQDSSGVIWGGINPTGQAYFGTTTEAFNSTSLTITSAAFTSATVAVFTVAVGTVVVAGQSILVAGVIGGTYNGTWTVTATTSTTITVLGTGFTNIAGTSGSLRISATLTLIGNTSSTPNLVLKQNGTQTGIMFDIQTTTGVSGFSITGPNASFCTVNIPGTLNAPSILANSSSATAVLFNDVTTGSVSIGTSIATGTINIGGSAVGSSGTLNLMTGATTSGTKSISIGTAGATGSTTTIVIGTTTGTTPTITLNGAVTVPTSLTSTGTLAVNNATITTTSTGGAAIFNTTALTSLAIGAGITTGTITIGGGAAGTITLGLASTVAIPGTLTAVTHNSSAAGTAMNIGLTSTTGSITIGGAATFSGGFTVAGATTSAVTLNIGTGVTASASTKAINIGTAGASGSTTNIVIGSAVASSAATTGTHTKINGGIAFQPVAVPGSAITATTYTQLPSDVSLLINTAATSTTITLLSAATYSGKILYINQVAAFTVISNASNVYPLGSVTLGTAILSGAGKFAMLQSDGTNWRIIMAN